MLDLDHVRAASELEISQRDSVIITQGTWNLLRKEA